jgi:hypothetical protein
MPLSVKDLSKRFDWGMQDFYTPVVTAVKAVRSRQRARLTGFARFTGT